jgi:hypothetical protein
MTWRVFIRAHWPALLAADFFTTEVWTAGGLMTYYTAFVIELHSRRVHVLGLTRHPDDAFVVQAFRRLATDGDVLRFGRFLMCDRDPKWSGAMEALLRTVGVRVVRTQAAAPNCNAHDAERFVRSIKTECLDRIIPLGEWHLRPPGAGVRRALQPVSKSPGHRQRADRTCPHSTNEWSCA